MWCCSVQGSLRWPGVIGAAHENSPYAYAYAAVHEKLTASSMLLETRGRLTAFDPILERLHLVERVEASPPQDVRKVAKKR